ncbi:GntR family transcriptional regulator [Leucobacter sp. CSA2]|uniref:GntR family transcriptional regulator n=1 Tax=Leucobacter edaphi TaxID=2796472 RepID=A0A934UWN9_9MICO|nr:GntR family transcriptional regulator [Leucobacter edaphi]MBK0420726.1 GntR family transcriptional regulator [Leucobacter edaphi]
MTSPADVARTLRDRILRLELPSGTPLREIALAEELGCSRRTVREALLTLGREGLVAHERNRGARVRSFGPDDIRDLYLVRQMLEEAGAAACADAPAERIAAVTDALGELREAARTAQDSVRHAIADMRFHGSVIALLGSPRLDQVFALAGGEMAFAIRLLQRNEVDERIVYQEVLADHERIHGAVQARDPEAAVAAVRAHIEENRAILIRLAGRSARG